MAGTRSSMRSAVLLFAALLSACGGGGSHALPKAVATSVAAAGKSRANFSIRIPAAGKSASQLRERKAAQAGGRAPQFVSPATKSVSLTVAGVTTNINTTNGSPGCLSDYTQPSITEIPVGSQPRGIITGADGFPYFVEDNGGGFGKIGPGNTFSDFSTGRLQNDAIVGPDGYFWIADVYGPYTIGHLSPDRTQYNEFGPLDSDVAHLGLGSDGSVWYSVAAVGNGSYVYHMSSTGTYLPGDSIPTHQKASYFATGSDGALYVSEGDTGIGGAPGAIARLAKTGSTWSLTWENDTPAQLIANAAGSDGAIWSVDNNGLVYRTTLTGAMTQPYHISGPSFGMISGPDGALWATVYSSNTVARVTLGGVVTEFPLPTAQAAPTGITAAADGSLYVTEQGLSRVARLSFATACTGTIDAPTGMSTATMTAYDATGGASGGGNKLSTQTVAIAVPSGTTTNLTFTLDGIVNSAAIEPGTLDPTCDYGDTYPLVFQAFDAAGTVIIGPGGYVDASGNALSFTFTSNVANANNVISTGAVTAPASTQPSVTWSGGLLPAQTISGAVSGGTVPGASPRFRSADTAPARRRAAEKPVPSCTLPLTLLI